VSGVKRTLGPVGAAGIGVASMVGAGAFYVWAPAAALAGSLLWVSLILAGSIALLNAVVMAQLTIHNSVSGGAYRYGQKYIGPQAGFLAGWFFLVGKSASAAAISAIAARYLWPENPSVVAVVLLAVFALANISGLRTTAAISILSAVIVVGFLITLLVGAGGAGAPFAFETGGSWQGVLPAAGLMFFAFAGYARMATLGEEVKNPVTVLPRVIVFTLLGVLALYSAIALTVLGTLGADALAQSAAPLAESAPAVLEPWVIAVATLASLGSLAAVLAGLSRTSMAMAQRGDLPQGLGVVWERTSSPARAEITMALAAIVAVLVVDPVWLVGASSSAVLSYYAIAHAAAIKQPESERILPVLTPWLGLVGCLGLVATLPWQSVATGGVIFALGLLVWALKKKPTLNH
jgi:basic amino acid/polyamine antiporter, APA family